MNKVASHRRCDIFDEAKPHFPGRKGSNGRPAYDNRNFINAVFWILKTGCYGASFRLITVIGKTLTDVFAVVATM